MEIVRRTGVIPGRGDAMTPGDYPITTTTPYLNKNDLLCNL